MPAHKFVNFLWDDATAAVLDPVGRLVYRSNLLGGDQRITNTGGGNTSSKIADADPLTGGPVEVLWVKGSGGDLRTSTRGNFSSLYQARLLALQPLYAGRADKGLKSPAEDDMVGRYAQATFHENPRAPSIDTPLHSFLPGKHVDHMHPNAIIAIAASANCEKLTKEIFGGAMAYVPWMRPGFELGLAMQQIARENPETHAIMMGQHGFISWNDDDKACYAWTLDCIEKAAACIEAKYAAKGGDALAFGGAKYRTLDAARRRATLTAILPWLRGQVSQQQRFIGTVQGDEKILRFVSSKDAPRLAELGTSCPDHFLRTKIKPLYVDWNPQAEDSAALKQKLAAGLEAYRRDYAAYYAKCRHANSPAMRDPNPTVVLIPGLGMIAWGRDKSESRVTAEFYNCAVEVMRGAEAIDRYIALPQQEAFDIEYWPLEEAKLQRMPAEKELARRVVIVTGAGSVIGREVALRLVKAGAHVVGVDCDETAAEVTAREITDKYGAGIGVAGTGLSNCGPAIGLAADLADRTSICRMLDDVAIAYGGFDAICVTAGTHLPSEPAGSSPDARRARPPESEVTGGRLVGDEAARAWREQGLKEVLALVTPTEAMVAQASATTKAPVTPADWAEAYFLLVRERLSQSAGDGLSARSGGGRI